MGHARCFIEYMPRGTTINAESYCRTLENFRQAIQNKRRGMLTSGVMLLHDNARPHTAAAATNQLKQLKWNILDHPPYSPDLAPCDFHLFPKLKYWMATQCFNNDSIEEMKCGVKNWLENQSMDFYEQGLRKLVTRYDKCLNLDGDYVEK